MNQSLSPAAMRMQMDPPSDTLRPVQGALAAQRQRNSHAALQQAFEALERGDFKGALDLAYRARSLRNGDQS